MMRMIYWLMAVMVGVSGLSARSIPNESTQCLVGIADDWNSSYVTLTYYEKVGGKWQAVVSPWKGRLGKSGLVWGHGIHTNPKGAVTKREGDWRSPAGIFTLGGVWGYAKSIQKHPSLPYRKVSSRDLWVEDSSSPQYNQHVILDHEPATDWEKKQQMKQTDPAHALKLLIHHNYGKSCVAGAGSSIFFHIWRDGGSKPTAGCTTMEEGKLKSLIQRIDPSKNPVYVLLPRAEYEKYRNAWALP